jgi:hypothetical protein
MEPAMPIDPATIFTAPFRDELRRQMTPSVIIEPTPLLLRPQSAATEWAELQWLNAIEIYRSRTALLVQDAISRGIDPATLRDTTGCLSDAGSEIRVRTAELREALASLQVA